jgi:HEAT repeat protein
MEQHPPLTLALFSRLTDRELQTNYLNHLDRTDEIATILARITDGDLALHIIDLALEVDLSLGAGLVSCLTPDLQAIVVKKIDELDICIGLKIELWAKTKSKAALPYLKDVFVFKHPQENPDYQIIKSLAIDGIIGIDRDVAAALLIESLLNLHFTDSTIDCLYSLAPVQAIEPLRTFLHHPESRHCGWRERSITILGKIGTPESIEVIRSVLYFYRDSWYERNWIEGLAIVREPVMVEYLIYLLYLPGEYIYRSDNEKRNREEADSLCCQAISAIEIIGGDFAFELLHRAMYWIDIPDECWNPVAQIVGALVRIDRERTLTALADAIQSEDSVVRRRAAMALGVWDIERLDYLCNSLESPELSYFTDRNLLILFNAIEDPDPLVGLEIIDTINRIYTIFFAPYNIEEIEVTQELCLRAQTKAREVLIGYLSNPDGDIRDKVIRQLVYNYPDVADAIAPFLDSSRERSIVNIIGTLDSSSHRSILLEYLDHEDPMVRAAALERLGYSDDDSTLSILIPYLNDEEKIIAEAAVTGVARIGSVATFSTLLDIATNPKLVIALVRVLRDINNEEYSKLIKNLQNDRTFTRQLIDIAETTLIELLDTKSAPNGAMLCFHWLRSDNDRAVDKILEILKSDECTYEEEDDGVLALASIGTERVILALLSLLPNQYVLGGWISNQLGWAGRLGAVPHLWIAQRQLYTHRLPVSIDLIQKREGLYNPVFSNETYPLYARSKPQLRDLLLGDAIE